MYELITFASIIIFACLLSLIAFIVGKFIELGTGDDRIDEHPHRDQCIDDFHGME